MLNKDALPLHDNQLKTVAGGTPDVAEFLKITDGEESKSYLQMYNIKPGTSNFSNYMGEWNKKFG